MCDRSYHAYRAPCATQDAARERRLEVAKWLVLFG
jgi:hypothetical protein